jgi:hypothetical protein
MVKTRRAAIFPIERNPRSAHRGRARCHHQSANSVVVPYDRIGFAQLGDGQRIDADPATNRPESFAPPRTRYCRPSPTQQSRFSCCLSIFACTCHRFKHFDEAPVVSIRNRAPTSLEHLADHGSSRHRCSDRARHLKADSEVFVHGLNVTACVAEPTRHNVPRCSLGQATRNEAIVDYASEYICSDTRTLSEDHRFKQALERDADQRLQTRFNRLPLSKAVGHVMDFARDGMNP